MNLFFKYLIFVEQYVDITRSEAFTNMGQKIFQSVLVDGEVKAVRKFTHES